MTQQILPQEMNLLQDNPCIRTKCPLELVTDEMVTKEVRRANLVAGDIVRVQCMDETLSQLLAEAEYRVVKRTSALKMVERPDSSMHQFDEITFEVVRWTDWRTLQPEAAPSHGLTTRWNFGKKGYDIERAGHIVSFEKDKETAHRIIAGEAPLAGAV